MLNPYGNTSGMQWMDALSRRNLLTGQCGFLTDTVWCSQTPKAKSLPCVSAAKPAIGRSKLNKGADKSESLVLWH